MTEPKRECSTHDLQYSCKAKEVAIMREWLIGVFMVVVVWQ